MALNTEGGKKTNKKKALCIYAQKRNWYYLQVLPDNHKFLILSPFSGVELLGNGFLAEFPGNVKLHM